MPVLLLPVLDTDPWGYNQVVAGRRTADEVAGPRAVRKQLAQIRQSLEAFREITGGRGGVTVHTSPFFRWTFLRDPFLPLWQDAARAGFDIVLHAHEDRPGGGHLFEDRGHLAEVIPQTANALRAAGFLVTMFRSGYCAFSNGLTSVLEGAGFDIDLSAAPGLYNAEREVDWRGGPDTAQPLDRCDFRATPPAIPSTIVTVPIGWDGAGATYAGHYLFSEVNSIEELTGVFDAIRARAYRRGATQAVLFLCHTYGLCDHRWRAQAEEFLRREQAALAKGQDIKALVAGSLVQ